MGIRIVRLGCYLRLRLVRPTKSTSDPHEYDIKRFEPSPRWFIFGLLLKSILIELVITYKHNYFLTSSMWDLRCIPNNLLLKLRTTHTCSPLQQYIHFLAPPLHHGTLGLNTIHQAVFQNKSSIVDLISARSHRELLTFIKKPTKSLNFKNHTIVSPHTYTMSSSNRIQSQRLPTSPPRGPALYTSSHSNHQL